MAGGECQNRILGLYDCEKHQNRITRVWDFRDYNNPVHLLILKILCGQRAFRLRSTTKNIRTRLRDFGIFSDMYFYPTVKTVGY